MGAALLQKLSSSSFELIVTFFHYFYYALFMAIPLYSLKWDGKGFSYFSCGSSMVRGFKVGRYPVLLPASDRV